MLTKPPKIVSKAIRDSAHGEICTLRIEGVCNHRTDTTVFAHLNSIWKGWGNKSPDLFGVYACSNCHQHLDAGKVSAEDQLRGLQETQMKLYKHELIQVK